MSKYIYRAPLITSESEALKPKLSVSGDNEVNCMRNWHILNLLKKIIFVVGLVRFL